MVSSFKGGYMSKTIIRPAGAFPNTKEGFADYQAQWDDEFDMTCEEREGRDDEGDEDNEQ